MMRRAIPAVLVIVLAAEPLQTQEPGGLSGRASVDSTAFAVGDRIAVHVEIAHPAGVTFQPLFVDSLDGFAVLDRGTLESAGGNRTRTTVVMARYDSGATEVPPLQYLSSLPGDSAARIVATPPVPIVVYTVPVDTAQEFKDLKPPLRIPWTLAEILLLVGLLALVGALAYLGYRLWKRRQRVAPGEAAPPPRERAPHLLALEELAQVKEKHLWQQGKVKEYYTEVTEVLRRYCERRFGVMALEQTTDEIMDGMRARPAPAGALERLETILRRADLVKFARHQPGIPEHEDALEGAYAFVDQTKPAPQAETEGKAGTHAAA